MEEKQKPSTKKSIIPMVLLFLLVFILISLGVWFYNSKNGSILNPAENTPPPVILQQKKKNAKETPPPVVVPTNPTENTPAPVTVPNTK